MPITAAAVAHKGATCMLTYHEHTKNLHLYEKGTPEHTAALNWLKQDNAVIRKTLVAAQKEASALHKEMRQKATPKTDATPGPISDEARAAAIRRYGLGN